MARARGVELARKPWDQLQSQMQVSELLPPHSEMSGVIGLRVLACEEPPQGNRGYPWPVGRPSLPSPHGTVSVTVRD